MFGTNLTERFTFKYVPVVCEQEIPASLWFTNDNRHASYSDTSVVTEAGLTIL